MKRILIVISSLSLGGGAEKVASAIGSEFQKKGNDVFYLTFYNAKEKYDFLGEEICLQESFSNNPIIKILKLFKRAHLISKYTKEYRISTCISFMEESNFPNILSKILFGNNAKITISIRASIDFVSKLYKFLINALYEKADLIIPNSKEEAENLIKKYHLPYEKIKVIHNPIDISLIQTLKTEHLADRGVKMTKDHFNFITIGRLSPQKDQKMIIESFIQFNKKNPKSSLFILGDGELKNGLLHISMQNKNIFFVGNQKNVYKFLAHADCFLFISKREGFPNAVLDAMACGLPVISNEFKIGIQELLKGNTYGILLKNSRNEDLIKAMENTYLDKNLRNHYKQKSLERAKDFQIENIIKKREDTL